LARTTGWFAIEDLGADPPARRVDDSIIRAVTRLLRTDLIIVRQRRNGTGSRED
jgi:hypothetical protein